MNLFGLGMTLESSMFDRIAFPFVQGLAQER